MTHSLPPSSTHNPLSEEESTPSSSGQTINVRERDAQFSGYERAFLPEIAKGIGITLRHIAQNLFGKEDAKYTRTVSYPDVKVDYPERFRGQHRLVPREDGAPRCVACFMCSTACPARCINIVAEESDSQSIEKRPQVFEIDMLKCIFCGMCVEACPEDAIRMDTGAHALPVTNRADAVYGKFDLLTQLGRKEKQENNSPAIYQGAHEHRSRTAPQGAAAGTLPVHEKVKEH